jgi:hypothetical protein
MDKQDLSILETIKDWRIRVPFIPFRIVMTSGEGYEIRHSELLAIGQSQMFYCFPNTDRVAHLRVNQIASVEELDAKPTRKRKSA